MGAATTFPGFRARLMGRREVAEGTMAFEFEKPSGWSFRAGQYIDITLLEPPETDAEGNVRTFSIASAPQEPAIMVATRMRDTAFKRVLRGLPLGTEVKIEGPFGNLTLHNNASRPAVLLAGGIGITPFRSMVLRAAQEKLPHRVFLFFSNRRPEDAAFLRELEEAQQRNPNYKLIATMTEMAQSRQRWQGETSLVNADMLSRHLKPAVSLTGPIYYIAGPPAMVQGLHATLGNAGVDDDDIRLEEFAGY